MNRNGRKAKTKPATSAAPKFPVSERTRMNMPIPENANPERNSRL